MGKRKSGEGWGGGGRVVTHVSCNRGGGGGGCSVDATIFEELRRVCKNKVHDFEQGRVPTKPHAHR